ncbi:MAG: hypothetical protein K1X78_19840 [Verrucomicrobiaceae bacterium]|nr:hypothetical protein [Verrucomicrobiaceae bacterium]
MNLTPLTLVPFFVAVAAGISSAESRTWTNAQGKQIQAALVRVDGGNVILSLASGQPATVALASLSPADQEYARLHAADTAGDGARKPWNQRSMPSSVSERQIDMNVRLVKDSPGDYVYRSGNFEFRSTAKLGLIVMNEVCRMFESTHELVGSLPWGIVPRPEEGRQVFMAELFETREQYLATGAPEWSGGYYSSKDKIFRIPFKELGLSSKGKVYTRTGPINNDTITHEITHQMMHEYLPYVPVWLLEGTAEYTSNLPYKGGVFNIAAAVPGFKDMRAEFRKPRQRGLSFYRRYAPKWIGVPELWRFTTSITERDGNRPAAVPEKKQDASGGVTPGQVPGPLNVTLVTKPEDLADRYFSSHTLVFFFVHLDGSGKGERLKRYFDALYEEKKKWPSFWKEVGAYNKKLDELRPAYAAYRQAMDEFMKMPGVKDLGGGRFEYPKSLTPPQAPPAAPKVPVPPDNTDPGAVRTKHLDVLLDGRTLEQLESEVRAAYQKIGAPL